MNPSTIFIPSHDRQSFGAYLTLPPTGVGLQYMSNQDGPKAVPTHCRLLPVSPACHGCRLAFGHE